MRKGSKELLVSWKIVNHGKRSFSFSPEINLSSPAESVEFHLTRGDFENWIRFLGDADLASQIEGLRVGNLPREQLMQTFVSTIDERHELLRKSA